MRFLKAVCIIALAMLVFHTQDIFAEHDINDGEDHSGHDHSEMDGNHMPRGDPYDENYSGGPSHGYGSGGPGGYGGGAGRGPPPPKQLNSADDIKEWLSEEKDIASVIGYFDPAISTSMDDKEAFMRTSSVIGAGYRFAYTTQKSILEESKYEGSAVIVHKPPKYLLEKAGEKGKSRYPSKGIKEDSLKRFIYDKAIPLVGEQTFQSRDVYENIRVPLVTIFADVDHVKNPKGWTYLSNRIVKVAKEFAGKLVFSIADKDDFSHNIADYGISMKDTKDAIGVGIKVAPVAGSGNEATYYKLDGKFSTDELRKFALAFKAGSLVGREKTPPPVESDELDPAVVTLTKDNFKAEVEDSKADVLLEFYAPWCGHCKQLKPEYAALARSFSGDSGVKIAAMDATAHTPPSTYKVEGYPMLYWLPADTKKPVTYDGEREEGAMRKFIYEQRTTKA